MNADIDGDENAALKEFLKSDYYRKLYEEAPDGAKAYYRNSFQRREILKSLADEDWNYLKSHTPNAVEACGIHATQQRIRKERDRAIA